MLEFGDPSLPGRIWDKIAVNEETSCWEWTGCITTSGYGQVRFPQKRWFTHRLVYTALVGDIPTGLVIDHLCRVRFCCNPRHLEVVTSKENSQRSPFGTAQGLLDRHDSLRNTTHCPKGHIYDGNNTYFIPSTNGRMCRTCMKTRNYEQYWLNKKTKGE